MMSLVTICSHTKLLQIIGHIPYAIYYIPVAYFITGSLLVELMNVKLTKVWGFPVGLGAPLELSDLSPLSLQQFINYSWLIPGLPGHWFAWGFLLQ